MNCSNCNEVIIDGAKFCSNCGSPVITDIRCPTCKTINSANSKFCKNCGKGLIDNNVAEVKEEGVKAWIKCQSCGETYYVENETELQQEDIYYNCSCGEKIEVAFFGGCYKCNEYVGFRKFELKDHAIDVGTSFLKGAVIGGVMGYFGLDYKGYAQNSLSDNTREVNASGLCPLCGQKHIKCYNCGIALAVGSNDVYTCPQCNARMRG